MAELGELLDADPRVPERLDRGPGPKRRSSSPSCPCVCRCRVVDPGPRRVVVRARLRRDAWRPSIVNEPPGAVDSADFRHAAVVVRSSFTRATRIGEDRGVAPGTAGPCATCENESPSACRSSGGRDKVRPGGQRADLHRPLGDVEIRTHELLQAVLASSSPFGALRSLPVRAGTCLVLVSMRCFRCGDLGARCSEAIPEWWRSRSRRTGNPS